MIFIYSLLDLLQAPEASVSRIGKDREGGAGVVRAYSSLLDCNDVWIIFLK